MEKSKHTKEFRTFMENIRNDLLYADQFLSPPNPFGSHFLKEKKNDGTLTDLEHLLKYYSSRRDNEAVFYPRYRWMAEILITRFIGFFDYYVSQVLKSVFQQKPDQLKGSKIDMEEILDITSKSDVIHRSEIIQIYADKKVHDLGYKGLYKLIEYLNHIIGLDIKNDTDVFRISKSFIQVRNIIVHNAGYIDRSYLSDVGQTALQIGDLHPFTEGTYIRDGMIAIFTIVEDIDTQLLTKFDLPNIEELDARNFKRYYLFSDSDPAIEDRQEDSEA